ncbi:MAG TPA: hypothetical protein VJ748_07445 [Vitreimonas sp.]|nr:hypothetical protein [Vitreimonas sp.]
MMPTRAQELAFLRSVTYASLFDYPLTLAQLHASLVEVRAEASSVESWWRDSAFLQATVDYRDGRYFPAGRGDLLHTRTRREALSRDLLEREHRILSLVARMPFVRMVALSGSLAHLNAERSADLDLFVITAPGRVWSVTLSVLLIARLLGWRKRMCLNYVISERAMAIEPGDLFSANQIIHLRPVVGHDVFKRFVNANPFVRRFYPNFDASAAPRTSASAKASADKQDPGCRTLAERALALGPGALLESMARAIYSWHLKRRAATWQSIDQVRLEAECLKLHTSSHRAATLERYEAGVARALQAAPKETLAS